MAKKGFSMDMNGAEFRRIIKVKKERVEVEVELEVRDIAKDIRTTLYNKTPLGDSFTAFKTAGGSQFGRAITGVGQRFHGANARITVVGGRARAAFTNSPKFARDAIFKINKFKASVGSRVKHQKFLEEGTRAHGPKTKKFLRFGTKDGIVFTKWVRGIRPLRIFKTTQEQYERILPKRIKEAVRKGLEK